MYLCVFISFNVFQEPELTKKGNNLIKSNVRQILKSVTYSRNLDMDLGLGLLNTLRPHDAVNWLEDALNKYIIQF